MCRRWNGHGHNFGEDIGGFLTNRIGSVAVIGSGVMGAGIAAHCANAGCDVLLLDIASEGEDRSSISRNAMQMMQKSNPEMLMHKRNVDLITPGNVEDDLGLLKEVDWVVEVVVENLEIKREIFSRVSEFIGPETIVSSNTSTIPRSELIEGMPDEMASRFLITHFFNPPRYLPLLEVVSSSEVDNSTVERFCSFAHERLGKKVILCKDTPGFIGNRLGIFFVQRSLKATIDLGLSVEQADAMLGRPIGVPKTAVFGLMDLVGIDLIPNIVSSLLDRLPSGDPLHDFSGAGKELVDAMISEGNIGRKGKGGFYRLNMAVEKKVKEARNLTSGEYSPVDRNAAFQSAKMGKQGLSQIMDYPDRGAELVREVILDTLSYAARIAPEISDDIYSIDSAMKVGYGWKRGPFEMMDLIGLEELAYRLESSGREVPDFLAKAIPRGSFYSTEDGETNFLSFDGSVSTLGRADSMISVSDLKRRGKPLKRNGSASVWDLGDEILLLEFHSKMNAIDPMIIEMISKTVDLAESGGWRGIVVGNDAQNFSAGANLGLVLFAVNLGSWKDVEEFISSGQIAYQKLKYSKIPVVAASAGMCLGGGAEILFHCDAIQAHCESYIGLVEVGVGIVPAWGGCKELIGRLRDFELVSEGPMGPVMKAFEYIGTAQVSKSAEQARSMGFLSPRDKITMNRDRLIADAKNVVLELGEGYEPPEPRVFNLPGLTGLKALELAVNDLELSGNATPHDVVVTRELARVLTGGVTDFTQSLGEEDILEMEREAIGKLGRLPDTLARMEHMLGTGKPLRN